MHDRVDETVGDEPYRFFTRDQVDAILREGTRLGRGGSHSAIERILKHEPMLERAELWKRIRQLKRPPHQSFRQRIVWSADDDQLLRSGYGAGGAQKRETIRRILKRHPNWESSTVWRRAKKLGLVQADSDGGSQHGKTRWSQEEDTKLIGLAGEMELSALAQRLGRSERAIACRLAWWGRRRRVHNEGFARKSLARDLHMGWTTIQRLIIDGFFEVRDPRITKESISELRRSGLLVDGMASGEARLTESHVSRSAGSTLSSNRAKHVWAAVADKLNTNLTTVEELLMHGVLKFCDPRVTESSLQEFCQKYGAAIKREFLPEDTRTWLRTCMDFDPSTGRDVARRFAASREHAMTVRTCDKCGRSIRGNVFFRHLRNCKGNQTRDRIVSGEGVLAK